MTQPYIIHEGKKYYQVGCRKCTEGDYWKVYSDGERFIAKCRCGNLVLLPNLVDKPDEEPIPLHLIS